MEKQYYVTDEIYNNITISGNTKCNSNNKKIIIKSISAGIVLAIAASVTCVATHNVQDYGLAKLISGFTFPVGLIMIVLCGMQLFTSEILDVLNIYDNKVKLNKIIKTISLVYLGNLIGTSFMALLFVNSNQLSMSHNELAHYVFKVANGKLDIEFMTAFYSGIICNILICFTVVAYNSAKDITGKILAIFFPIMAFAISGVEHCVANMYYLSSAFFATFNPIYTQGVDVTNITINNIIFNNLVPVTIGNIVGGILVAIIIYNSLREK